MVLQTRLYKQENYNSMEEKLFYALLYRSFDDVTDILELMNSGTIDIDFKYTVYEFSIKDIAEWNYDYFEEYDTMSSKRFKIKKWMDDKLFNDKTINSIFTYDEIMQEYNKSIFEIFFSNQPLLNVNEIKGQELPARQIQNNKMSLVLDEVGSGKSVSALYSIADIIDELQMAHILIVCPSQLKDKWQNDIRRQIGRYSHIVSRGDADEQYSESLKEVYFREKEQCIFIIDNVDIAIKTSMQKWSKSEDWDLVIIDECHLCTDNYYSIRGKKVMLLTATPIVISNSREKNIATYTAIMKSIVKDSKVNLHEVNPLKVINPTEEDIFVNRFREDFNVEPSKRIIRFEHCMRDTRWYERYQEIVNKKDFFTAIHSSQDDDYLYKTYNNLMESNWKIEYNGKMIMLKQIIGLPITLDEGKYIGKNEIKKSTKSKKSYIVFCEHIEVVDNIYKYLRNSKENLVVAKKYGNTEVFDEGKCEKGTLASQLQQCIKDGKQTVLITTGLTGGTGLNLGYFDAIIHYELPFTSIQLEQRYGRIDRIDKNINQKETNNTKVKEMIFLLNEYPEGEFLKYNRMLYYSITKIDKTSKIIPIRNTVLFFPEMEKQVIESILSDLYNIKGEQVFEDDKCYTDLIDKLDICKHTASTLCEGNMDDFTLNIDKIVNNRLKDEVKTYKQYKDLKTDYDNQIKIYIEIKKIAQRLLVLFGKEKITDDIFEFNDVTNDENEYEDDAIIQNNVTMKNIMEDNDDFNNLYWKTDIENLIFKLKNLDINKLEGDLTNGIFYFDNNRICHSTVLEFRNAVKSGVNEND